MISSAPVTDSSVATTQSALLDLLIPTSSSTLYISPTVPTTTAPTPTTVKSITTNDILNIILEYNKIAAEKNMIPVPISSDSMTLATENPIEVISKFITFTDNTKEKVSSAVYLKDFILTRFGVPETTKIPEIKTEVNIESDGTTERSTTEYNSPTKISLIPDAPTTEINSEIYETTTVTTSNNINTQIYSNNSEIITFNSNVQNLITTDNSLQENSIIESTTTNIIQSSEINNDSTTENYVEIITDSLQFTTPITKNIVQRDNLKENSTESIFTTTSVTNEFTEFTPTSTESNTEASTPNIPSLNLLIDNPKTTTTNYKDITTYINEFSNSIFDSNALTTENPTTENENETILNEIDKEQMHLAESVATEETYTTEFSTPEYTENRFGNFDNTISYSTEVSTVETTTSIATGTHKTTPDEITVISTTEQPEKISNTPTTTEFTNVFIQSTPTTSLFTQKLNNKFSVLTTFFTKLLCPTTPRSSFLNENFELITHTLPRGPAINHCTIDKDCPSSEGCRLSRCVNPCLAENNCPIHTLCTVTNHKVTCLCKPGYSAKDCQKGSYNTTTTQPKI